MLSFPQIRLRSALLLSVVSGFIALGTLRTAAQDDPNEAPLGDVARNLRKKTPDSQNVIDNDNLMRVMDDAEKKHGPGSSLKFLMAGEGQGFHVSAADVTCNLSFSANTKALLSGQYAQMDLPAGDMVKLAGPATIEGDALTVSVFNGTEWHVSEVDVALTVVKKSRSAEATPSAPVNSSPIPGPPVAAAAGPLDDSDVRPEKKPDVTVIYRMRAAAPPWSRTVFSAPLNLDVAAGDEWHWALVEAKGYPPQGYAPQAGQTTATNAPAVVPTSSPVIPASLLQPDSPESTLSQTPR